MKVGGGLRRLAKKGRTRVCEAKREGRRKAGYAGRRETRWRDEVRGRDGGRVMREIVT